MRLSTRLMAAMVLLVLLTAAAVAGLTFRNIAQVTLPHALDRIDSHVRLLAAEVASSVGGARADVEGFRAAVAIDGIVRASLAGGVHPLDGTTVAQWRDRMASRFVAELAAKPAYAQFRIIGLADGGREILRVDRSGPNEATRTVPDGELQRKADRDYFQRTIGLSAGEIYVSPVELNREDGQVETPPVPVIRTAAPIHAPDGRPFGIVVINVDLRSAFDRVRSGTPPGAQRYIVNERGDYLVHPDRRREFEFGAPARIQDDFPGLGAALQDDRPAPRVVSDRSDARLGMAMASVRLAEGPKITVIEAVPYSEIMATAAAVHDSVLLAGAAAMLGAMALAVAIARTLTRPLVQMTHAVTAFGRGQPMAVPTTASGEIGVLARAFADMTADVQAKTEGLRQEVDERRRIVDMALDAFVQMDQEGRIVEWNPPAETIFGWSREEAVGRMLVELIIPTSQRAAHRAGLSRFLATGDGPILGRRIEINGLRRDGKEIRLELTVIALRREDHYVFNGFMRDVTAKIAAEEQLRQSQKLEAVGQLTGGIAHDFNNILTVITGTSGLLADALADRPDLAAAVATIDKAADRGAELTRRLLAFARKQPLRPTRTDVNALIVEAAKLLRPTLGEDIEIESMLDRAISPVLIDPSQLTSALVNLALNARDAMPNGGKLTIETRNALLDESYAAANAEVAPGPYVVIGVSDTGVGIPAAILDKVFEPFFTTKEAGKGTGLGLSMVYGFIKQSGGHIKIYSEEGHGTTIRLYLPPADKGASLADDAPAGTAVTRGHETILVVEDDVMVRDFVVAQLHSLGYQTLAAANGSEALALVNSGAAFDLLFTDVIMPGGMNGRQLAEEIARRRPGVKVLYTSGYTENAIMHHGRLDPGVALLNKPYRMADLAKKVRAVLDAPADGAAKA